MRSPLELRGLDLAFKAELPDVLRMAPEGSSLAPLPATVSGRLIDRDRIVGVRDLALETEANAGVHARLSGEVRDLKSFAGVELDLEVRMHDLSLLAPLVDWPLPKGVAVEGSATLSARDGTRGLEGSLTAAALDQRLSLELRG